MHLTVATYRILQIKFLMLNTVVGLFLTKHLKYSTQGDSGDATDDEMVSRKTRSCKEGLYRNGPESDSIDQEDPGDIFRNHLNLLKKQNSVDVC